MPEALWKAVAEALAWAYRLDAGARRSTADARATRTLLKSGAQGADDESAPSVRISLWLFASLAKPCSPRRPRPTSGQPAVTSEGLAFQARTALGTGDVAAFSALFATADELTDPQRRFHAKLTLIDAGMGATSQASEGLATRMYVAVAERRAGHARGRAQ